MRRSRRCTGWTSRFRSAWPASGCSSSSGSTDRGRCSRPTIRTSRRRSRMKPTDPPPPTPTSGRLPPPSRSLPAHAAPRKYDDGVVHYPHDDGQGHDDLHNEDVAHEHQDVDLRAIGASAAVIIAVAIASQILMVLLFNFFESDATARQLEASPVAAPATDMPKRTTSPFFSQ